MTVTIARAVDMFAASARRRAARLLLPALVVLVGTGRAAAQPVNDACVDATAITGRHGSVVSLTFTPLPCEDPDACAGDLVCATVRSSDPPLRRGVSLRDQFAAGPSEVLGARFLCTPASRNGRPMVGPGTSLAGYRIEPPSRRAAGGTIRIANRYGETAVDPIRADLLLVPSNEDGAATPAAPDPRVLGRFTCYQLRRSRGTSGTTSQPRLTLTEPAGASGSFLLTRPRHLCVPTDRDAAGVGKPLSRLLCYAARRTDRDGSTRGLPRHTSDEFGAHLVTPSREREVCVPSLERAAPP